MPETERLSQQSTSESVPMLSIRGVSAKAVAIAFIAGWAGACCAEPVIEGVNASIQGGREVLRIDFSEALAELPRTFAIHQPPRISIDLPGVTAQRGRSAIDLAVGNLRSASVVPAEGKTRVVVNLAAGTTHAAQLSGKSLLLTFDAVNPSAQRGVPAFAEPTTKASRPIRDVDFRRAADGAGRIVVDLPSNQVGVSVTQQGKKLVLELLNSSLPQGLRRRLDVADFGTPVQTVTTDQDGEKVRIEVQPVGDWEHSAYQSDSRLVVEVRPLPQAGSVTKSQPRYVGERLSLNFQNIEVRALLQVIADFTDLNIVTSDSVAGSLTMRLKNVPWDQALELVLQAKGLAMRQFGNVIRVAPKDELAALEKADLESKAAALNLEPLRTEMIRLNYAKAADIAAHLTAGAGAARMLSARGSAVSEPRTNQVLVTDVPSRLEQIAALVRKLDLPLRQVLIEARIVEATDTFGRTLGARLGGSDLRGVRGGVAGYSLGAGNRIAFAGSYDAIARTTGEIAGAASTSNTFVNLPAGGIAGVTPASFAFSLFSSAANRFLDLEISALEADGKGKVVSAPKILTADQTKSLIEQGIEFPYQQATSSGATSVAFRRATLKLEVTPQITPERAIILDLDINKDSKGEVTAQGIAINTKHIKTQVLVENGGTVVIGGIFDLTEDSTETRVPVVGELPVVGNIFRSRGKTSNKQEMLVFITPRIMAAGETTP
jgi:type IV pilus assembly protein PilQ